MRRPLAFSGFNHRTRVPGPEPWQEIPVWILCGRVGLDMYGPLAYIHSFAGPYERSLFFPMAGIDRKPVMTMHFFNSCMMRCVRWLVMVGLVVHVAVMVPDCIGGSGEAQVVHLYFADAERPFLVAEARVMLNPGEPAAFGRQLMAALIGGPAGGNLATVPAGTRLRALFVSTDGTAVVDFSTDFRENHPGSCRQEQLSLFSVVNSLILNVPEIDRVKILIDGAEAQTLAGHLPLEFPLTADMLLTR
jgi:hypothetical protein